MGYILAKDTLNGKQGKAFITLHKDTGDEIHELFSAKKVQTKVDYQKADLKVIGTPTIQKKVTGASKTGTMTIYFGTPLFTEMAREYEAKGKVLYFDMQVTNEDPTASIGKQTIAYYDCSLDSIPLSILDADADFLEQEVGFSYTTFEVLENFTNPATLG